MRCAQDFLWIASNARSGPIPLPPAGRMVWEEGEAFSLWIGERSEFSRLVVGRAALWFWRWGGMPWGAPRERSCARREARGRIGFCAARRVFVDRFQCLLRTDPAAALVGWMSEEKLVGLRGIDAAGAGVGVLTRCRCGLAGGDSRFSLGSDFHEDLVSTLLVAFRLVAPSRSPRHRF